MNEIIEKENTKLYHFYNAVEFGSFQAAARGLRTTASALAYSINELEKSFQAKLLIRTKGGVKLTDFGSRVFDFSKRYFKDLDDIFEEGRSQKRRVQRIKIGTFSSIALYFGPLFLKTLQNDKLLRVSITTNRSAAIIESLLKRDIDIALTVEAPKHNDLNSIHLYSDQYAFYVSKKSKLKKFTAEEFQKHSLLFMPDAVDSQKKTLSHHMREFNLNFNDDFQFNSLEVIAEYCKNDLGVAILPQNVYQFYKKDLKPIFIEGIPKSFGEHHFYITWRNDSEITQKNLDKMLVILKDTFSQFRLG